MKIVSKQVLLFLTFYFLIPFYYGQNTAKDTVSYVSPDSKSKQATPKQISPTLKENVLIGFGLGLDYGGIIGFNVLYYPYKYVGLFAGAGYAVFDLGYNAGIKLRYLSPTPTVLVSPYIVGMYGYNTAIQVSNASRYDKLFYGITIGTGIDFKFKATYHNYISLAVLFPIRGPEVNDYITELKKQGVRFENDLLPVGISVGFRLPFKRS